jgi:hypothetical protein
MKGRRGAANFRIVAKPGNYPSCRIVGFSDKCPQKPVAGLPTELVNDKGIGHTTGTPDTGNIRFIGV